MSDKKFEVGEFAYYVWGYGQTNVDWFKVVKRNEKSVWFVPVPAKKEYAGDMHGYSVPVDKPIERKVDWKFVDGDYQKVEMSAVFRRSVKVGFQGGEMAGEKFGNVYPWDGNKMFFSEWY